MVVVVLVRRYKARKGALIRRRALTNVLIHTLTHNPNRQAPRGRAPHPCQRYQNTLYKIVMSMHGTCPKINNMAQSTVNGYTIVRGVSSFENVLHQRTHGMHVHISVGSVWPERQVELKLRCSGGVGRLTARVRAHSAT